MNTSEIDPITADVLHAAVHDLKGPAGRLRMLAQLLARESVLDENGRGLLGHIQDSAAAVGDVAEGIRLYTEICARPLRREALDLNQALATALAKRRAEAESAGVEIVTTELPQVQADPFLMTWLFQELLANAIRFRTAQAPRISISSGDGFISVHDNGPGIEPDLTERVFKPFKKLSAGPGAGLGLTICRKIVEMHEGRMWVEPSTCGVDIRFFVGGQA